ncbi:hypothetical protein RvY_02269 [Ramazzottius varieornatus]|uniref:Uncharacterized protein n=1 Tax=Ramazzottius varieornatus TaxID=947166 RepID=A0A1D1UUA5_RAMVA|nr:hypothetical protein RvY_02269 [Ramazzottius varieornatus]
MDIVAGARFLGALATVTSVTEIVVRDLVCRQVLVMALSHLQPRFVFAATRRRRAGQAPGSRKACF